MIAERYAGMALQYAGTEELKLKRAGSAEMSDHLYPIFGFAMKGNAKVTIRRDNKSRTGKVLSGELFYLPTGARCTVVNDDTGAFHAVWIRFVRERSPYPRTVSSHDEANEGDFELCSFRVPQIRGWISDFLSDDGELDPAAYYRLQSHLYAIASVFFSHIRKPRGTDDDLIDYVEQTKRYMLERYGEPIDVEELARQSGASSGRFYQAFRTNTGLSPHKYMTTIRLNISLNMLAHSGISITEVAHSAGYADELYFSRLFKKHMGMSPTEYAACANKKIVMPPIFVGDLSVLGITPEWVLDRGWSDNPEPYVRRLAETKPELILTSPITDELSRTLAEIAPVVSLHWKGYPWKERLLQISDLLGISTVAERWLAFYDRKVENARQHVRRHLGDTPFLLASSFGERFRIYGMKMNKVKDLFYDDLQVVQPVEAQQFGLLEVDTVREIADQGCDHLLLLMPAALPDEAIAALEEEWRTLKPDRPARSFIIRYEEPLMYNAAMYASLIDQTVNLLLQTDRTSRKVHGWK